MEKLIGAHILKNLRDSGNCQLVKYLEQENPFHTTQQVTQLQNSEQLEIIYLFGFQPIIN